MKIKVQYDNQDFVYEIPAEDVLKHLKVTKKQLELACKKAIMEI